MGFKEAVMMCSSLPVLGCVISTLVGLLPDSLESANNSDAKSSCSDYAAAQKHLKQIQNIRTC